MNAFQAVQTCLQHYCKKEYNAYQRVFNNYMKEHQKVLDITDPTMKTFLECKLEKCKPHVIKLRNLLLQDAMNDLKVHQTKLKKETDPKKKLFYKDIIQYNQKQIQILKKIDVNHITLNDLQSL